MDLDAKALADVHFLVRPLGGGKLAFPAPRHSRTVVPIQWQYCCYNNAMVAAIRGWGRYGLPQPGRAVEDAYQLVMQSPDSWRRN